MKKTVSILLTVVMILGMVTVFASAETKTPDYASAKDGDVLYTVDFRGTDGIYEPFILKAKSSASIDGNTVEVSADGTTITTTANASEVWIYGGAFKGLTLGADKKYTMEFTAAFPAGNAGVNFNFPETKKTAEYSATADVSYTSLYGFYGKLTGTSISLTRGSGTKINGNSVSSSAGYTASPVDVANGTEANIRIEIDGYFYSVFINDTLYDSVNMLDVSKCSVDCATNLGFAIYIYNKNAAFTVKNVTVKKGCTYTAAAHDTYVAPAAETVDKIDYASAAYGAKLADLKFNSTTGAFRPTEIAKNSTNTMEISADGSSYKSTIGDTKGAEWYGGSIGGLKITDSTTYTFKYKVKAANATTYVGGIAYNCNAAKLGSSYRLNWYGAFTNTALTYKLGGAAEANAVNAVKYAYNGSNFSTTGYDSDATMAFRDAVALDGDGFADVAVELKGWVWTYYVKDAQGNYQKLATVDNSELLKTLGTTSATFAAQDLGFQIYTYNVGVSMEVKNVELYKGVIISDPNGSAPATGDSMIWVAVVALVSVLGMGITFKAVRN